MLTIFVDIDGTLADCAHRAHFVEKPNPDWVGFLEPDLVLKDTVINNSLKGVQNLMKIGQVEFLTGRNEKLRYVTNSWLKTHFGVDCEDGNLNTPRLLMRPIANDLKPTDFKKKAIEDYMFYNDEAKRGARQSYMAFDDDPYMQQVYLNLKVVAFQAPQCWNILWPDYTHLTNETLWRK